ncbi:hypothetical protein L2W11_16965, partial [Sediminivirga luteola]|nr:hypothetical protein [Sediminivirga luteola]
MSVPLWAWFAVLGVILVMLAVDLVAHRKAHVIGVREAAAWSRVNTRNVCTARVCHRLRPPQPFWIP